jgi:hypothetical protein
MLVKVEVAGSVEARSEEDGSLVVARGGKDVLRYSAEEIADVRELIDALNAVIGPAERQARLNELRRKA